MCNIWNKRRCGPVCFLAAGLGERGRQFSQQAAVQLPNLPFFLLEGGEKWFAHRMKGADVVYVAAGAEEYTGVCKLAEQADEAGALLLWSFGEQEQAPLSPLKNCVMVRSAMSAGEELQLLAGLLGCGEDSATVDRAKLLNRLQDASHLQIVMATASGREKRQKIAEQLTAQGWKPPEQGSLVASIGAGMNCRLEEVLELWQETARRTMGTNVLWASDFARKETDTLRLALLTVMP